MTRSILVRRIVGARGSGFGARAVNPESPVPNPQSPIPRPVAPTLRVVAVVTTVALAMVVAPVAEAKIAVFVDGRILKVDDAYLENDRIILELKGGGRLEVAAIRIDRVIADEVEEAPKSLPWISCPSSWSSDPLPEWVPYRDSIQRAAEAEDLHPWLLAALVQAESNFDPAAVSRAGAKGLTQLMPAAAADEGVKDVFDPVDNLRGGASHLRKMLDRFEALHLALAAYNAGAATVDKYDGIPPYRETQDYVRKILTRFCPG